MQNKIDHQELINSVREMERSELERKRVDHALRASEERLDLALDASNSGIWDFNPHTFSDTHYNDRWFTMLGYEPDELPRTAETWTRLLHPDDVERVQKELQHHIDGKGDYSVEFRMKRKDGDYTWIHSTGKIVSWDEDGHPKRMIGIHHDITERMQDKEELRSNLHFFESLERINEALLQAGDTEEMLKNAMDIVLSIFNCDRAWLLYPCDPQAPSWEIPIERTRPEFPGALADGRVYDTTPDVAETFRQLLATDDPVHSVISQEDSPWDIGERYSIRSFMSIAVHPQTGKAWDFGLHQCTHARVWTQAEQRLFKAIGHRIGDVLSLFLIMRDLQNSEQKFRNLVESSSDWIWEVDLKGVCTYSSPQAEGILGYTPQEMIGKRAFDFMMPDEAKRIEKAFQAAVQAGKPLTRLINTNQHKEGHATIIETNGVPIFDEDGDIVGYRGMNRDITERVQSQQRQQHLQAQLVQSQKIESIGRLAGGVAHDFNNMLSVILGNTEMMQDGIEPDSPFAEHLQEILEATQRSMNLTRQLLAFARKQTVEPVVLDLNRTLDEMVKMLQRLIGEDINLSWRPADDIWLVKIDPSQLDQILANLCVNARDAIKGVGNLRIETRNISITEADCQSHVDFKPGDYIVLSVGDDGCGMDQETLANLFEPFYTTKGVGQGSGLGLATVYGIVKQNGGFINVSSKLGEGTTFKIFLPRNSAAAASDLATQAGTAQKGDETILVVEDERGILKMTKRMLERLGYTVLAATLPSEAIRMAEAYDGKINLLVTDVVMREMNGRDLADQLLINNPGLKCLYMSGYTADVIAQRGVLDEGVQFISKPFSKNDLATKVRDVMEKPVHLGK